MTIQTIATSQSAAHDDAYRAGHTDGTTEAAANLPRALSRIGWVFDHLSTDWATGYWDAVLQASVDSVTTAWNTRRTETA
jgi:hypothetical protein